MADKFADVEKSDPFASVSLAQAETELPPNNTGLRMTMAGNVPDRQSNGSPEAVAQIATSTVAEPISGLAGLLSTLLPIDQSPGDVVKATQEKLSYAPKSEEGKAFLPDMVESVVNNTPDIIKKGGSWAGGKWSALEQQVLDNYGPEAATALSTLPTAILEAIPAGLAIKKLKKGGGVAPAESLPPEQAGHEAISNSLKGGDGPGVASAIQPDQQILTDAEALGIDLNPSHYSTSRAYKEMEQSLKSRPGSSLSEVEDKAIIDLGNRADELIDDLGGYADKSLLDSDIKSEFDSTITELSAQSDALYTKVGETIPRATRTDPQTTRDFISQQLEDLGGDESLLTTAEKRLINLTKSNPTYAALDRVRRDIGSAIGSKSGPFKDDDLGQLKQLYAKLSEDQERFADAFGVGDDYRDAKALVSSRKAIEDQAITLFGREFSGSFIPKLTGASTSLTKGDVSRLKSLINAVPEARRQEVVATMLNNLFTQGARTPGSINQGFVKAFDGLNRNAAAKTELFKHLPDGAEARFDMIGRVSTGLYSAKALENTSKTARDVIAAMDDGGMFRKIYGMGKKVAVAEGASSSIGVPGAGTAAVIGSVLTSAAGDSAKLADELLSSPSFRQTVLDAAEGKTVTPTNPEYTKWLKAQNPQIQSEIAAIGFVPWLTSEDSE